MITVSATKQYRILFVFLKILILTLITVTVL